MSRKIRRVAVLFSRLSGYMAACLTELSERHGIELLVFRTPPAENAPFADRHFDWIGEIYDRNQYEVAEMEAILAQFAPDAIFMVGWAYTDYLRVARKCKNQGIPVVAGSDAQWTGSVRQQVARLISPWYLHSAIDALWVAGERQRQFAQRLGFSGPKCWTGYYSCNWPQFARVYEHNGYRRMQNSFLFVGRYVQVKGLDTLVEAYRRYREVTETPWQLTCVGSGEQAGLIGGIEGIVDRGFVQPDNLPDVMAQASTFVLPSRGEPWGVVVQEAAAAGLPLICSNACGSAVHLLQDGYNGFLFETGNAEELARCFVRMTELGDSDRRSMGTRSHELSKQYTPRRWADTFVEGVQELISSNAGKGISSQIFDVSN